MSNTSRTAPTGMLGFLGAIALVIAGVMGFGVPKAQGQCGLSVTGRFGGETGAVAQVNVSTLVVGRGSTLELIDLSNTNAPAAFNPRRTVGIDAPAKKIAHTPGSGKVFAMMENGDVCVANISLIPAAAISSPVTIHTGDAVDIVADGTKVYIVTLTEDSYDGYISSYLDIYETSSGTPALIRWISPFLDNYGFDRAVKIGNTIWLGMHEFESSLLGVEAYDVTVPTAPVRVTSSLNNAPLGTFTRVSAMHAIGNRLLLSYEYDTATQIPEDWMRAVDVTTASNPVWFPPVDLNGFAGCMASTGNLLRISIKGSGIGTWDTSNPAALTWLGAYFDSFPQVSQMLIVGGNDYWAAGRGGLMTMNTINPASVTVRSNLTTYPIGPSVVKQYGNTTVVLDYTLNTLRLYDYTLPESQQLRSSVFLPLYAELVEIGVLAGGTQILACVATQVPGTSDSITIYDITNPAAPVQKSQITGFEAHLMSVVNSRMYVMTTAREFKVIELAQPLSPQVRSTTPFGGNYYDYTCLTGWEAGGTKAVGLGTDPFGLWIINVTDATAPLVSTVWNPVSNYRVSALAQSGNYLFVSARVEGTNPGSTVDARLETLNVTNLANVTQRFVADSTHGIGYPGVFSALRHVSTAAGKFLVATQTNDWDGAVENRISLFSLPAGFLTGEAVPFFLSNTTLPHATGPAAVSADGSRFTLSGGPAGLYQMGTPVQWAPGYGIQNFDQSVCFAGNANFIAFPAANPTDVTVQWYRYGPSDPNSNSSPWATTLLVNGPTGWGSTYSGVTEVGLTITGARSNDRKFYYYMVATNSCGPTPSRYAVLRMCPADFNCSGAVSVQDIFDFLSAYFAQDPRADFNGSGSVSVQDIFDFLAAYFTICF